MRGHDFAHAGECLLGGLSDGHAHVALEPAIARQHVDLHATPHHPDIQREALDSAGGTLNVNAIDFGGRLVQGLLHRAIHGHGKIVDRCELTGNARGDPCCARALVRVGAVTAWGLDDDCGPQDALFAEAYGRRGSGFSIQQTIAQYVGTMVHEISCSPRPAGLLVGYSRVGETARQSIGKAREPAEGKQQRRGAVLHVRDAAAPHASIRHVSAPGRVRPAIGVVAGKDVEVSVQHEMATGLRTLERGNEVGHLGTGREQGAPAGRGTAAIPRGQIVAASRVSPGGLGLAVRTRCDRKDTRSSRSASIQATSCARSSRNVMAPHASNSAALRQAAT